LPKAPSGAFFYCGGFYTIGPSRERKLFILHRPTGWLSKSSARASLPLRVSSRTAFHTLLQFCTLNNQTNTQLLTATVSSTDNLHTTRMPPLGHRSQTT
jgi:hypothetical protein